MIIRIVKMTFKPQHVNDFLSLFHNTKEHILSFEGCHHLQLLQDKHQSAIFFTYSIWEKESYLQQYRHSELFKNTWQKTKVLFDAPPEAWTTQQKFKSEPFL